MQQAVDIRTVLVEAFCGGVSCPDMLHWHPKVDPSFMLTIQETVAPEEH